MSLAAAVLLIVVAVLAAYLLPAPIGWIVALLVLLGVVLGVTGNLRL